MLTSYFAISITAHLLLFSSPPTPSSVSATILVCRFSAAQVAGYSQHRRGVMKVIVADKINERGVELLKKSGLNAVLTTKDTIGAESADAHALIVRSATRVTAELLDKAPKLRAVGRAGVGVDNIDLPEATKRGVLVMSTPGGNAVSVAEHTFALMLALARQVPKVDAALREGRWEKSSSGTELR